MIVLLAGMVGYYYYLINRAASSNNQPILIEIKEGTSSIEVSDTFVSRGIVNSSWAFLVYTKLNHQTIKAGFYSVPFDLSIKELVTELSSGQLSRLEIIIPEGKRIEQIAAMLEKNGVFGYNEFIQAAKGREGTIFADTYYIRPQTSISDFIKMVDTDFTKNTSDLHYSHNQLVLASMIERETNIDEQKPIIAGIFQNRLDIGMKLQSDPTAYYVNDSQKIANISPYDATQYVFWQPPTATFKSLDSPYNTYLYEGLPPQPICTPSLTSLEAAINPQKNNYLYFLHDKSGNLHPASNLQDHEANIKKYL